MFLKLMRIILTGSTDEVTLMFIRRRCAYELMERVPFMHYVFH